MAILIKRYANRKLYNTATSRYITLKGIAELLDEGEEVRVVDNETGEDITKVALSQILVDTERTRSDTPSGLLSQILGRGGDALYEALRKGVGEANENLEEIQDRFRRFVRPGERRGAGDEATGGDDAPRERRGRGLSDWIAYTSPDVDEIVQNAMERVFKLLDLPRRSDIDALNENLRRVAHALERLEKTWEEPEPARAPLPADDARGEDA
ncbi:MAG: polyhydroxyalkanoate synthesis regulator DNA-binding domain-containing protein [Myxococcota bacterium]|nr:polyhydroxyalkanoate synthesis regulator DNA-binding domain-containing protein [Myxococcales bacterium]